MRHVPRVFIKICRIILHDQIMKSLDWCDITKYFFCYPSLKHVNLPFASIFIFFQWFHQGMLDKGSSSKQVLNRQYKNTWLLSIVYNIYSNVKKRIIKIILSQILFDFILAIFMIIWLDWIENNTFICTSVLNTNKGCIL